MRFLWLTLADPDPPTNGQFIYSRGLIHAIAESGARLDVMGMARAPKRSSGADPSGIGWWLADEAAPPAWRSLFSTHPNVTFRTLTQRLQALLLERLRHAESWDAVIFDSIALGWGLGPILKAFPHRGRPELVYIAHNHEATAAAAMTRSEPHPVKRLMKRHDAFKVSWLESALLRHCDLITANTQEDCARFRRQRPDKPVQFLPAGYGGRVIHTRDIDATIPRRVVIIGSFDWPPKRSSLESFLAAAVPQFQRNNIELQIVGNADSTYLAKLRQAYPSVHFTGFVQDIAPYIDQARAALVPDWLGGFKLKSLDYIFNRLPILAMEGSVPGVPLTDPENILYYRDHAALGAGVCRIIDNFEALNRLQNHAFATCADQFSWSSIGMSLLGAMEGVRNCDLPSAVKAMPFAPFQAKSTSTRFAD